MKCTFLHISDLHYRADWHEENGLVCIRFIEDIKSSVENHENLYLVFSGDIVYEGADNKLYSEFETNFAKKLDVAGLSKDRRICTPGNHDISRDALKPFLVIQKGTLDQMTSEKLFNDNLSQNSQSFLAPKFENYKTYEAQFARFNACESGLGGTGWEVNIPRQSRGL